MVAHGNVFYSSNDPKHSFYVPSSLLLSQSLVTPKHLENIPKMGCVLLQQRSRAQLLYPKLFSPRAPSHPTYVHHPLRHVLQPYNKSVGRQTTTLSQSLGLLPVIALQCMRHPLPQPRPQARSTSAKTSPARPLHYQRSMGSSKRYVLWREERIALHFLYFYPTGNHPVNVS